MTICCKAIAFSTSRASRRGADQVGQREPSPIELIESSSIRNSCWTE